MMRETSADQHRSWRDPFVLAGIALVVVWAVVMLPWLDLETRAELSQRLFDPAGLLIPGIACGVAARRSPSRQGRLFWWLLAAGLGAWMIALLPRLPGALVFGDLTAALWADVWYLVYYVLLFFAASLHPGEAGRGEPVRLQTAGLLLLVAATVLYTVLLPANLYPDLYASRVSSFLLYFVMDALLLLQFASLARRADSDEWRPVHGWIAAGVAGFVFFDAVQGLWLAGLLSLTAYGTPLDAAWQAPLLAILVAARLPGATAPARAARPTARPIEHADSFPGRLILFASVLPVLHLFIYGVGLGDPRTQQVRVFIALIAMLALQALAVVESRRLVRRNRRLRRAQLEAAARMQQAHYWETVGRLAGGIAHEFNNILTAILGHAGLLRDAVADDPQGRADLDVIERSGSRATELVRQMLAFGRRQSSRPEPLELPALLGELVATRFPRLVGDRVELRTDWDERLPAVFGDRQGLVDALTEIVANAGESMPDGGRLSVSVRLDPGADGPGDDRAVLSIRDTGRGMQPEVLARVFEPFFTTKEVGQGTGLGLSSALGTVEQMGGQVDIRSSPGDGTVVDIRLPVWRDG